MIQTPSFPSSAQTRVAEGIRVRSRWWQQCIRLISHSLWRTAASLLRFRLLWGTPSFSQFERRSPVERRLGPGLSRDLDSFWPVSEWWI